MNSTHGRRAFLAAAALQASGLGSIWAHGQSPAGKLKMGRRGVNICGAEFGVDPSFHNGNPGRFGQAFTYNSERTVAYFATHGLGLIRLPFRWERVQPRLRNALDKAEVDRLALFIDWAQKHGASVILDLHNYGRYTISRDGRPIEARIDQTIAGHAGVTRADFADLWRRLANRFANRTTVVAYGLMNEPHDMADSSWKAISQAAVDAIRATGDAKPIMVAGESYSNSEHFTKINGPKAWINDPSHNIIYEAHCYFDSDFSGSYRASYDDELLRDPALKLRGKKRIQPFLDWCARNRVQGIVGEYGVPGGDARWLELLPPFFAAIDQAGFDACYWAAGEWWGKYPLSIQPGDDFRTPAPQLAAVARRVR